MTEQNQPKAIYMIDEDLVHCISNAAYKFVALLDAALWDNRLSPVSSDDAIMAASECCEELDRLDVMTGYSKRT